MDIMESDPPALSSEMTGECLPKTRTIKLRTRETWNAGRGDPTTGRSKGIPGLGSKEAAGQHEVVQRRAGA